MKFSVPVYVEQMRTDRGSEFRVSPLFIGRPMRRAQLLSRAVNRLAQDIRGLLERAGKEQRHDELKRWSFSPHVETIAFDEKLLLRHRTVHCRCLVVAFDAFDRRVAFSPALPEVWFDVAEGASLRERARETFTAHFRACEKEDHSFIAPADMEAFIRGSVTEIELEMTPAQTWEKTKESPLAALMGERKMEGREELERVGRRLDMLFPDDLDRAILRDAEVAELTRLMEDPDRRPVLLVGPRMSGKTTLVHEYVFRRLEKLLSPFTDKHNIWLLSPQRLISGMMYVGQWENRLLTILDHAKKQEHVLYFEDLPGLFHAGLSSNSNLSVAHVLRPYIERRDVRVLAEITPESLRVLQERDRGFADLFHIIPVREPPEPEARRLLIAAVRQLEGLHGCRLGIDVLPAAMELQQRYVRELALPGKVAVFLKDLATKYKKSDVSRREVLAEFHAKSGLSVGFLDRQATLERADVIAGLRRDLAGQSAAVDAMADVVAVAKAQLNDPGRPVGSFLFLGPTGVGKTQAAKALARYLFGDAERLLRFDMNEYVDPYSAARLVGTWVEPEGVLTSAVRRQPFSVILLDEIEKAHPDVLDLLLQVLGEGRLSDSLGRTSEFGNTVIIMTSNLGVREASVAFGFSASSADAATAYRQAAERFFRPEFFNRIDRIVPFERLTRQQTRQIAERLIADVLAREGLQQRRCMLSVTPAAMERLVDQGYHPDFGARALRRAIDRQLVQPVAARLAAIEPGTPTLLRVFAQDARIGVHVRPLVYAERTQSGAATPCDPRDILHGVDAALERLHEVIHALRPPGRVLAGEISAAHGKYFALREQFDKVERLLARAQAGESTGKAGKTRAGPRSKQAGARRSRIHFRALMAASDLNQYLAEVANAARERAPGETSRLDRLVREASFLDALASAEPGARTILLLRALVGPAEHSAPRVLDFYVQAGCTFYAFPDTGAGCPDGSARFDSFLPMWIEHDAGAVLLPREEGIHLVVGDGQRLLPVQAVALRLAPSDDPATAAMGFIERQRSAPDAEQGGTILRIYERNIVDLRTGFLAPAPDVRGEYADILLAQLPLPPELEG